MGDIEVHQARIEAIKPRACPACGSRSAAHRPYAGRGWTVRCICGVQIDYFEDSNDATLAWNAMTIKAAKLRSDE